MLDVTRLRVLDALARRGSVTAAAEELHYSQPTVSHHLARLEAEVGAQLTQRVGRGVRLTPAGQLLADRAAEMDTEPFWLSTVIWPEASWLETEPKLVLADTSPLMLRASTEPLEFSTVRFPAMCSASTPPKLVLAKVSPSTSERWMRPLPVIART